MKIKLNNTFHFPTPSKSEKFLTDLFRGCKHEVWVFTGMFCGTVWDGNFIVNPFPHKNIDFRLIWGNEIQMSCKLPENNYSNLHSCHCKNWHGFYILWRATWKPECLNQSGRPLLDNSYDKSGVWIVVWVTIINTFTRQRIHRQTVS
jgi:hypothetical protein